MNNRKRIQQVIVFWLGWVLMFSWSSLRAGELPDFTGLVKQTSPAVVNISTTEKVDSRGISGLTDEELQQIPEFFRHFFGAPYGFQGPNPQPRHSMGSGFIISDDGYILTNNHVVENADEIIVRLIDRRELPAKVIGTDKRSDVALLKVEADHLPVVEIGDSNKLDVGEWVLAIGSPFGFDYTVTAGIVSALGRSLPNENYVPFIQTDVAINPGNSGGPLFNLDGKVVGINSQIYTRSGGFMGVSFAIPIDVAMNVVEQLKTKGYVSRGWLGVLIQEVSKDLAEGFGLEKPQGALVAQVMEGSPAEEAGVKPGDIIIEYNGHHIVESSDLPHLVGRTKVGEKAKLKVVRDGDTKVLTVKIGELPEENSKVARTGAEKVDKNRLNVRVKEITDREAKSLGIKGGVKVIAVGPGAAQAAGIRSGDVITSINREPVETVKDFERVVEDLPSNKAVATRIIRDGNPLFIVIKIKE